MDVARDSSSISEAGASPGLRLLLGPTNSGKLGRVIAWWGEVSNQPEAAPLRPLVVVPTTAVGAEVIEEIVRRSGAVVGQWPVVTFDGLVREVLPYPPRYLTDFQRDLVLHHTILRVPLPALAPALGFPGLTSALASALRGFGESGRTPAEVQVLLSRWGAEQPQDAALAADLARVLEEYGRACRPLGLSDRSTAVREAADTLGEWTRPVAFYGFSSFTRGQKRLIESLAIRVPVLVTFDRERGRRANLAHEAEVTRWERLAAGVEEMVAQPHAYSSPAIAHLVRHFSGAGPSPAPPEAAEAQGVRFLVAAGERSEAELTAEHVAGLLAQGFQPADIAVVVRHPAARGRVLGQVFASCGIPFYLDAGRTLSETGLGRAFLNALRGLGLGEAAALLAYLRTPYSGLDWEQAAELEASARRSSGDPTQALVARVDEIDPLLLEPWRLALRPQAGYGDTSALRALAGDMLARGLEGRQVGEAELEDDAAAFAAVSRALAEAEEMAACDGAVIQPGPVKEPSDEVGTPPLLAVLVDALGRVQLPGRGGERGDGVAILSPSRARARRFAAVFILGLVEGEFPARSTRPSLLGEAQRRALTAAGGGSLLTEEAEDEEALFLNAVSRAWQAVYLSARDTDDDGGEALPSPFWARSRQLLEGQASEPARRTLADVVFPVPTAPTVSHQRRAEVAAHAGRRVPLFRRAPASLHHPTTLAQLAATTCFSPSSIEAYLSCPFRWFLERAVRLEERIWEPDGRALGELVHLGARTAFRALEESGRLPLRPDHVPEATRLASAAVDEYVFADDYPGTPGERRLLGWRAKELLGTFFAMEGTGEGSLVPAGFEMEVGGEHGVDIGGIHVRGRIDRLDRDPTDGALFVVDYKTGKVPARSHLGAEDGLQLLLYLLALQAEQPRSHLIGGCYLSPKEAKRCGLVLQGREAALGSPKGRLAGHEVLSEEETAELYERARELAVNAAEGMRKGRIAPLPDRNCPDWCRLDTACRARKGRAGS